MLVGAALVGAGYVGTQLEEILATYSVSIAKPAELVADVMDTITLQSTGPRNRFDAAVIVSNRHATGVIWATLNGADPAVDADDVYPIGPGEHFPIPRSYYGDVDLKLISSDPCPYWVRVV